jgi:hypothetical protein
MKDGSIMTREYVLPVDVRPMHSTVALLLELYNQPEAVNKRNRFMAMHDDAIVGAVVTPAADDMWIIQSHYTFRRDHGVALLPEDRLNALKAALRQDAATGTLGHISQADLQGHFIHDLAFLGVIDLFLDSRAAGAPAAFVQDIFQDDYGNVIVSGLVLTIVVKEHHVNTARFLRELG